MADKKQESNKISGRQLCHSVNHTLTQLSAEEEFIEFCHHESFKTEKEQKLH